MAYKDSQSNVIKEPHDDEVCPDCGRRYGCQCSHVNVRITADDLDVIIECLRESGLLACAIIAEKLEAQSR